MNRFWIAGLLLSAFAAPASAAYTSIYAGIQLDNTTGGVMLGYQINKTYAIEAQVSRTEIHLNNSGLSSDKNITAAGLSALALLPMKLEGGSNYYLFAKAGYERINKDETYSSPNSIVYNGTVTSSENRVILGGGAQYDFYKSLSGRAGIDIVGDTRSIYLSAIFKF